MICSFQISLLLSIDAVMAGQILGVGLGNGMRDGVGDRGTGVGDRGAGVGDRGEVRDRCVAVDGRGVRVHGRVWWLPVTNILLMSVVKMVLVTFAVDVCGGRCILI